MANGTCDNLLLATYLSASVLFILPAMDLDMYKHPSTATLKHYMNLEIL
jgi:phosphopantothenoylcysteine decarboxylase/phosphopantothenate--cysteine ligase